MTYWNNGLHPIPVKGKSPVPKGATGREGTVTLQKVQSWVNDLEWRGQNTALRSDGSWIALDVDHGYDGKTGADTIRELEEKLGYLPMSIHSTARGQGSESRQMFYRVPAGARFISRLNDVEIIQQTHRYSVVHPSIHPTTGEPYVWYAEDEMPMDEVPSLDEFEDLPEAWVEYLRAADEHEVPDGAGFGGTVEEWLKRLPQGEPSFIAREWVNTIPQGQFGHAEMVSIQASIVSLASRGETGVEWALAQLRGEWLRGEFNTPEFARDFDRSLEGAVEKFGALPPSAQDVLDVDIDVELIERVQAPGFVDRITTLPPSSTPEGLRHRCAWLITAALSSDLTLVEAAALAWSSVAAKAEGGLREQGVEAMWELACVTVTNPVREEVAADIPPAPMPEIEHYADETERTLQLTTGAEDAILESSRWWGDEFMDVMASLNPVMSEQYYRLNRWMILSLIFADKAHIPMMNGGRLLLNFYGGILGPSDTGKTEAMNPLLEIPRLYHGDVDDPSIGGDATPSGITLALLERDGKASLFHADEADGILRDWSDKRGAFAGMKNRVMQFYTGHVPAMHRSTMRDQSGHSATTYLNVHLTGVWERVVDAIEPHDWISGFVNRFVWARGEKKPLTEEQMIFPIRREGQTVASTARDWYGQWVAQFQRTSQTTLLTTSKDGKWVDIEDEVLRRHLETRRRLEQVALAAGHVEQLTPTFGRLEKTILKCAALVAITEQRTTVTMMDYLIALRQSEEWVQNMLDLVSATEKSPMAREIDRLAAYVESQGGAVELAQLNRLEKYQGRSRDLKQLIDELASQGRAEMLTLPNGAALRLKGATAPTLGGGFVV